MASHLSPEDGRKEVMADNNLTTEQKQALLLDTQLETQLLTLDRTRKENAVYSETEEDRQEKRRRAQLKAAETIQAEDQLQRTCMHQAGVKHNNPRGKGVFGTGLTLSNIFFPWNWLIQCPWCKLKNQTPNPMRKSTKPQEIKDHGKWRLETEKEVRDRVKLYEKDLKRHTELLIEAQGSPLEPMVGPQFQFSDSDGMPVIPQIR
jgi:hypothetical protein